MLTLAMAALMFHFAQPSGVGYSTSATYEGATRYGRKTTARHMSGRDPALLPSCVP